MQKVSGLKRVASGERLITNVHSAAYQPFVGDAEGTSYLRHDHTAEQGCGFYIYKMRAGTTTLAHEHTCDEQWLMIEGELVDNDGTVYRPGDLVLMKRGTQHSSTTVDGCLLAVYIATPEINL